jgi:hypothetical protein
MNQKLHASVLSTPKQWQKNNALLGSRKFTIPCTYHPYQDTIFVLVTVRTPHYKEQIATWRQDVFSHMLSTNQFHEQELFLWC